MWKRKVKSHYLKYWKNRLKSCSLDKKALMAKKDMGICNCLSDLNAENLVKEIVDGYFMSSAETYFGDFMENIAKELSEFGENKSHGLDLEGKKEDIYYLIEVKSGPHWGNSSSINDLEGKFKEAIKDIEAKYPGTKIRCINICCYGKPVKQRKKKIFEKIIGNDAWKFLTGKDNFLEELTKYISSLKTDDADIARVIKLFQEKKKKVCEEIISEIKN